MAMNARRFYVNNLIADADLTRMPHIEHVPIAPPLPFIMSPATAKQASKKHKRAVAREREAGRPEGRWSRIGQPSRHIADPKRSVAI